VNWGHGSILNALDVCQPFTQATGSIFFEESINGG
jgi:hypothetical protein